ncbi:MAG: HAMP domain-containing histidine kinase [Proteobacteria bacterium]|nr:HAMP domain-containing histidine kinase [Pseudomonadota bacterium]
MISHLHTRFFLTLVGSLAAFAVGGIVFMHVDDGGRVVHVVHSFIIFPALALCIGIATYPLTRRLLRRLERLEQAVDALGAGDLSARVAVEGRDEVARLAQSFNRAAGRIEELVAAHKRLLANASHELRTPLARVRLAVELIGESADPKRKAGLDGDIAELDQLIDEILLASRLDAVADPGADEEVDLLALAAEECARYRDVRLDGVAAVRRGDPRLLRRLLRNLLDNAQRHGAAPIEVRLTRLPGSIEIAVDDAGPTLSAEQSQRLFEPFYRPAATERNVGTGLGLSLVRQIAQRHGGDAAYRSLEPHGNSFVVTLPLQA